MATGDTEGKCSVTSEQNERVKGQLDEKKQWNQANLDDLRSRERNDGEEEQAHGCFKAKLRAGQSVLEKVLRQASQ